MSCEGCTLFASDALSGLYIAGCMDCNIRRLANSIEHADARMRCRMTPAYVAKLRAVFGNGWEKGHMRVKAFVMGKEDPA
jgi:hypothetical protein